MVNRISVYKTDKKLIEFRDKLNPASADNYAELQGHDCSEGFAKLYSNIGICLYDYSKGTGSSTVQVYVNISPEDIYWLYNALTLGKPSFDFEQTKIFGLPDQQGYSQMTKLRIVRAEVDKNGVTRRYPWCITAEQGVGIAKKTAIGGTYCQSGTYKAEKTAWINLSDHDLFCMVCKVVRFIQQFENAYCPSIIRQGKQAYWQQQQNN